MNVWEALVLGLIQGITEFLPVSSSGHLVIAGTILGVETPGVFFEVMVHVATLISVLTVYRGTVMRLVRGALSADPASVTYLGQLALASVPAALVGVLFDQQVARAFDSTEFVGIMLLVTGGLLWSTRWALRTTGTARVGWRQALLIGVAQAFAILPGISRSGSTVTTALWLDVDADTAAEFSFLMSVPVILGAGALEARQMFAEGPAVGALPTTIAFIAAAVSGVLAIRLFCVCSGTATSMSSHPTSGSSGPGSSSTAFYEPV